MVSNCTVPRGVGSITASGKKLQERMLTVCQQCLLWFLNKKYCAVHVASLSLFDLIGLSFACTGKNGDLIARQVDTVSNCTVPGGVGSITASGKKLQERMLAVCQQCLLWFFENELLYSQVFPCSNCSDCLSHAQARTA